MNQISANHTAATSRGLKLAIMIEPGRLEWQGILLLSSLITFGRGNFSIHCFCREENLRRLKRYTRTFLKTYDIPMTPIRNEFDPEYPHGNKIIAAELLSRAGGRVLFLDTDVFLSRPFDLTTLPDVTVGAIPAGMKVPEGDHLWPQIYARFNLPVPRHRTIALTRAHVMMPYYNAGFVLFDADRGFGQAWADCAAEIERMDLPHKRPWLDQLALPVAAEKCGGPVTELPHAVNFNINNTNAVLPPDRVFLHYHKANWLIAHQYVRNLLNDLLPQTTRFANLKAFFEHYDGIAEAYHTPQPGPGPGNAGAKKKSTERSSAIIVQGDFARAAPKTFVVFGIMRGGTTMVAGVLNGLGIHMGTQIDPHNQEDACFHAKVPLEQMAETARQRDAAHQVWGWKFPNAVNYLEALWPHLRNPHAICVFRDSVSNGAGLSRWHGQDALAAVRNNAIQQKRNTELIMRLNCPAALISYEKAVQHPEQFVAELGALVGRDPSRTGFDFTGYMTPGEYKRFEDYRR